jgi:hypothetical protein
MLLIANETIRKTHGEKRTSKNERRKTHGEKRTAKSALSKRLNLQYFLFQKPTLNCFSDYVWLKFVTFSTVSDSSVQRGDKTFLRTAFLLPNRVARFFLVQNTKTGKIYQITTNFTQCP